MNAAIPVPAGDVSAYNSVMAIPATPVMEGWAYYVKDGNDAYIIVSEPDGDLLPGSWGTFTPPTTFLGAYPYSLIKFADYNELGTIVTSITTRISTEESIRLSADNSLSVLVSAEASSRTSGDLSLTTRVSAEESSRTSGDLSLTTRVSSEESVRASADTSLTTRISTEESIRDSADISLTTRVSAEESSRTSGDLSLTTRLSTEESVRLSADNSLSVLVSNEASLRISADNSLSTLVSNEASIRLSADGSLTTRLTSEESSRASADLSLTTRLTSEESSRASADLSLTTRVSAEESTRGSADLSLTNRVSTEESVRLSADNSLNAKIATATTAKVLLAKVGQNGLGTFTGGTTVFNPIVAKCYIMSTDLTNIVDRNNGTGGYSANAGFTPSLEVFVNGMLMRPGMSTAVVAGGAIKVVTAGIPPAYSFTTADGDYVLYKNGGTIGILFRFDLVNNDEVHVRYLQTDLP